jgi:prophage maintenance system killer protein
MLFTGDKSPVRRRQQADRHAAMETFFVLNGYELVADVDDAEKVILMLAAGDLTREELLEWVGSNLQRLPTS